LPAPEFGAVLAAFNTKHGGWVRLPDELKAEFFPASTEDRTRFIDELEGYELEFDSFMTTCRNDSMNAGWRERSTAETSA
jgi:hypothetical protein